MFPEGADQSGPTAHAAQSAARLSAELPEVLRTEVWQLALLPVRQRCEVGGVATGVSNDNYSGDSNRDLHTLQVVRGAEFPVVSVRTRLPEDTPQTGTIHADLQVEFAGQTAEFKQVPLELIKAGDDIHITGTLPVTLSDFKISPPSLLAMPIKNEIPIRVDMTWHEQK